jgi:predicted permease
MPISLKLAIRNLRRSSGFTLLAVSILALGIGATTAMFSIIQTVLLKPLPYANPERLAAILFQIPSFSKQISTIPVNAQHYQLWRDHSRTLQDIAMIGVTSAVLGGIGEPEHVAGARVSANFFHLLGVEPRIGRSFIRDEDEPGRNHVVIISHHFWLHELAGRANALGQEILLDGEPYQVIGIMPPAFLFPRGAQLSDVVELPDNTEYWVPLVFNQNDLSSPIQNMDFIAIARLRPGVTLEQSRADLAALEGAIEKRFPEPIKIDPVIHPLQQLMSRAVRLPLIILMLAVSSVLLIVCINTMNLMMVRAISKRRDWAIQMAVGARMRDVLAGALGESLLLAVPAAITGVLIAALLLQLIRLKGPHSLPGIDTLAVDGTALLFALGISCACAILFGIWPARCAAQADPQTALQSGRSTSEGAAGRSAGQLLVAAEVALSTVLLLTAGLLLRSFIAILDVNPGVNVRNLWTARINLPPNKYQANSITYSFCERLVERVSNLPGVEAAGLVSTLPIAPEDNNNPVTAADRAAPPITQWPIVHIHSASNGYFRAAGIPVKEGRPFEPRDGTTTEVMISSNLAARLWPGERAVGHPLKFYPSDHIATVVGVVGAVRASSLTDEPGMSVYIPDWLQAPTAMSVVLRTLGNESMSSTIRRTIRALEPQAAVPAIETMRDIVENSVATERFQLVLLLCFAAVALVLAAMGIYGVLAFTTARRTSEIGLRMALGAHPKQILTTVISKGMAPVLIGMVVGLGASAGLSRLLRAVLFHVRALDPLVYLLASLVLLSVAVLACFIPGHRAASLSPTEALRHE